jgi:hypothetical protein
MACGHPLGFSLENTVGNELANQETRDPAKED